MISGKDIRFINKSKKIVRRDLLISITTIAICLSIGVLPVNASSLQIVTHTVIVKPGEVYDNVRFPSGTRLELTKDNHIYYAFLSQDFIINGHLLKKGTQLGIHSDGTLREIWTQEGQEIGDIRLDKGIWATFDHKGRLKILYLKNQPKEIQGYRLIYTVQFHPTGKILEGILAEDQTVGMLHLREKTTIRIFPSGQIQEVVLSDISEYNGLSLAPADRKVFPPQPTLFWPNDHLKEGVLASGTTIQGFDCGPGPIAFYESGRLHTFVLGRDRMVIIHPYKDQSPQELSCKAGDGLHLDEEGTVIGWQQGNSFRGVWMD